MFCTTAELHDGASGAARHRIEPPSKGGIMNRVRIPAATIAAAILTLTAVGCGGDDEGDGGDGGDAAASESGGDSSPADIDAVTSCLSSAGFEVTREAEQAEGELLTEALKQSTGMIENVKLGSIGETRGLGSVGFYDSADAATEQSELGAGFRTDDVMAGTSGTVAWDYIATSGEDPGVQAAIEGCLT